MNVLHILGRGRRRRFFCAFALAGAKQKRARKHEEKRARKKRKRRARKKKSTNPPSHTGRGKRQSGRDRGEETDGKSQRGRDRGERHKTNGKKETEGNSYSSEERTERRDRRKETKGKRQT